MAIQHQIIKVPTICPICKSKKSLEIPDSILNKNSNLTTISLPSGLMCNHHFQIFLDKNFKIRGYQKVDFEIKLRNNHEENDSLKDSITIINDDGELYRNLLVDGNYLEFQGVKLHNITDKKSKIDKNILKKEMITLQDIYEEFWDFIDHDNPKFEKFILKDKRRINLK